MPALEDASRELSAYLRRTAFALVAKDDIPFRCLEDDPAC